MKKHWFLLNTVLFLVGFANAQISTETEQFINLDGEKFHYTDYGHGDEVILCLHGIALSSLSYRSARSFFDSTEYRILALDLKGNGFSAKPRDSDYSLEKQAQIIEEFLFEMHVDSVNLIGHSYGGMNCLFLNYKQSIDSLNFKILSTAIMDTPAYNKHIPLAMKVMKNKFGAWLMLRFTPLEIRSRIAIKYGFYDYGFGRSEYLEIYKKLLGQRAYPNSIQQAAKQVIPNNFTEISDSYKSFEVPFLILWGSHDNFIDIRHAQGLIADIENSTLMIIEKTAHNPHEERPEIVYPLIKQFISNK